MTYLFNEVFIQINNNKLRIIYKQSDIEFHNSLYIIKKL